MVHTVMVKIFLVYLGLFSVGIRLEGVQYKPVLRTKQGENKNTVSVWTRYFI